MNLLNYTLKYLSITLLLVISTWAALFYFNMIDEVRDSLDDGLGNNKMLVIYKVEQDSSTISRAGFAEHNYAIREISKEVGLALKDHYKDTLMSTLNEDDLEPYRMLTTAFSHEGKYYEMKVVSSTVEEDDLLEDLLYSVIWLYGLILVSILVVNNLLLRRIWAPFYQLLQRLKSFRLNKDREILITDTNVKEFKELNQTVSGLVKQSVSTYGSQKQFIENAAHELQTPLAICLNRLELLAENEDLCDQHLEAIGQVIRTLERLTRLNKSLLLLSRIENKQYGEAEQLSVNEIVQILSGELDALAGASGLQIELEETGQTAVTMNRDLAAILITNLLKNAIAHNSPGGQLRVLTGPGFLMISNTGRKSALDPDKIFKRFEKDGSEKNSTGLGLAIVKAITDLYGYRLTYFFDDLHNIRVEFE